MLIEAVIADWMKMLSKERKSREEQKKELEAAELVQARMHNEMNVLMGELIRGLFGDRREVSLLPGREQSLQPGREMSLPLGREMSLPPWR